MVALIAMATIGAVTILGTSLSDLFSGLGDEVVSATP
jgi:Flp pilus assembly pilin Flp